ncbi:hypothetical protein EJ05DRAFT_437211 [Pseudovirgaria hyperparasitica]|uniref:Major facilitator superfamily transporter n=1 Tax=Pseudovirgaria hyperparasitica TaxID=470096 RepID=A0A6A6WA69_9PEZI|nr:uncharacterized protein EJ05DRAFT_437211 [Pseudovirgaria hyperparasitica]KAF2759752.1 hypothetical protein EJ05DRAFT_437211 [Pseudovirgaria hyperparasitica]
MNTLRLAKRKGQSYQKVSAHDIDDAWNDLEKRPLVDDNDSNDSPPSCAVSSRPRWRSGAWRIRSPRAFTRCFSLVLGGLIILFIITLTKLGAASSRAVSLGLSKPKPQPIVWEAFPFLKRYHGGIRTLVQRSENEPEYPGEGKNIPDVYAGKKRIEQRDNVEDKTWDFTKYGSKFNPYPDYSSDAYVAEWGPVKQCYLDAENTVKIPQLYAYSGVVKGTPDNVIGSYDVLGLNKDVCFERYGRLGPYGYGYSKKLGGSGSGMAGDREGIEEVWKQDSEVDYRNIDWADVQDRCLAANRNRFAEMSQSKNHFYYNMGSGGPHRETMGKETGEQTVEEIKTQKTHASEENVEKRLAKNKKITRNAVIIRTWWDYNYDDEDIWYLRAVISELAIQTGGEYTVHFLVHVKDDNLPIWSDDQTYQRVLNESLPEEFRGMGTLWTERQMGLLYGGLAESFYRDLPVHGVYRSTFMPFQYFAHQHPEYDFFWQWEMDLRYTGHFYHLLDKVGAWARQQPRKLLWERSSRFYVPSEHGSWDDFNTLVKYQTEHGTGSKGNMYQKLREYHPNLPANAQAPGKAEDPIWGPLPPLDDELETDNDVNPPEGVTFKSDKYEWGVGEDADLITFNPIFDPDGTNWILADDVTGYNTTRGMPPRRTAIITFGRLSKRLLNTMHRESSLKRHTMFSEMWPASTALHHGLKAVYAPHPVYIDRRWPTDYLAAIFNGGRNGAAGGARLSVFSDERQHNFRGTTWYYDAGFAPNLWKRWMGYKVDNDGGEQEELEGEGRMCLPAMLVHPVKQVDLVFEESDRADGEQ